MKVKFRIWDSELETWIDNVYLNLEGKVCYADEVLGSVGAFPEYIVCEEVNESHEVNLSTGLQDRNGKEIYEGDIVKAIPKVKDVPQRELIGTVEWYSGGFNLVHTYRDGRGKKHKAISPLQWIAEWYELEVMGNVHENPRLFRKVKK